MSAVEEYRSTRDLWSVTMPEETAEGTLYRPNIPVVRKSLADAAIAELEAEVERLRLNQPLSRRHLQFRLEQAEAEVLSLARHNAEQEVGLATLKASHTTKDWNEKQDRIAELEAKVERLKWMLKHYIVATAWPPCPTEWDEIFHGPILAEWERRWAAPEEEA